MTTSVTSSSIAAGIPAGVVAVAVSGGADSLFTLLSLREAGISVMAVHGIFGQYLESWLSGGPPDSGIPATFDGQSVNPRADKVCQGLMAACESLGVPLHFLDCAEAFVERVIRPFVELYAKGDTPNPCALCNAGIKLGLLRQKAQALGANCIATGHYVRLVRGSGESGKNAATATALSHPPALLQGSDPAKDQSYFMALVPRSFIADAVFPLGPMKKSDVLAELARRGLTPPQPGESQEVCFIPGNEYRDFLPRAAKRLGIALSGQGPMLLENGTTVGTHKGLWQYTEGQRKGLGVAWKEPLHVLAKEEEDNILRLGPRPAMQVFGCVTGPANILFPSEYWPGTVYIKTRYRERPKPATVKIFSGPDSAGDNGPDSPLCNAPDSAQDAQGNPQRSAAPCLRIQFAEPDTSVAPGQIAAVYIPVPGMSEEDGRPTLRLAAGGVITQVDRKGQS